MAKKILVAGGGGYVGTSLVPALAARGHDVKVADLFWFGNHLPHEIATEKHDFFSLTPDDLSGFDVLVFLAGLSNDPMAAFSPRMNFIANTAGPVFLAHQAKTAGVRRFIHGGTCSVYGFADNTAMNEDSPTMPAFPYGVSKLAGERGVLALADDKFEVVGFRKGTVCGHSPRMRFDLVVNATNSSVPLRRLETRLLVLDTNGAVYGVTYKWRPDNSDADLLTNSLTETIEVTNAGGVVSQNWYYPSRSDCLLCHTAVAGYVLGVNTRQLNGPESYPETGVVDNQLRTLNRLGLFNPAFDEAAIAGFEHLSSITNTTASLAERARSYLDANCAQCHQPGGTGITFDARYDTPLANQNIVNAAAAYSLGYDNVKIVSPSDIWRSSLYDRMNTVDPTIKMPTLARNLIDSNAVAVMAAWINGLGGTATLPPPSLSPAGGMFTGFVNVMVQDAATNGAVYYTLDGSLPTTNSALYSGPILLRSSATVNVNAWAPGYVNSVVSSGVFTIQPGMLFYPGSKFDLGEFEMMFSGPVGSNYILQTTTNLPEWTSIQTDTPAASPFMLMDTNPAGPVRFYRVLELP